MKINNISELVEGDQPNAINDNLEIVMLDRRRDVLKRAEALNDKVRRDAARHGIVIKDYSQRGLPQPCNPNF